MSVKINGIDVNPETAELVALDTPHWGAAETELHRFDEALYRNASGMYFIVRPLDPDEARAWVERQGDTVLLRRLFPDAA